MSSARNMPGNILGNRYMLLSLIAKGGMGEVWKSRDQLTGKVVAVKVLRPELSGESLPLNRLRLEAQNALLIEHPNIASVFDSGEDAGRGWIVMELVDGRPLTEYVKNGQKIAPEFLIPVLAQMAMALSAASQAGVVHRDIKPANVLIRTNGTVKLTDFGISRTKDQVDLTQAGMVMGTAQYLPPEQALGEVATSVGDLYSVGVIAYEASAGKRPFTGKTQVDIAFSHVHDPVPPLPEDVPPALASVIYHLLEKEPSKRPENGQALMRELSEAAGALGVSLTPRPLPEPAQETPHTDTRVTQTSAQPVVSPVRHTRIRSLPEEMLAPVDMNSARLDAVIPETVTETTTPPPRRPRFAPTSSAASGVTPLGSDTRAPHARTHTSSSWHSQSAGEPRSTRPPHQSHPVTWQRVDPANTHATRPFMRSARTQYSRHVVAPHMSRSQRLIRWLAALVIALLIFGLLSAAAYQFIGSRLAGISVGTTAGILMPEHADGTLGSPNNQEAHHV